MYVCARLKRKEREESDKDEDEEKHAGEEQTGERDRWCVVFYLKKGLKERRVRHF